MFDRVLYSFTYVHTADGIGGPMTVGSDSTLTTGSDMVGPVCAGSEMDTDNLIGAVNRAVERKDASVIHRGCFILNHWGYRPFLSYPKYVKGPYSYDVEHADICCTDTCIPDDVIERLRGVLKDEDYSIAYCLLLLIKKNNPYLPIAGIVKKAYEVSPYLKEKIDLACKDLFDELRCAGMRVHM